MATEESKLLDDDRERRDSDDSSLSEDEAEKGIRRVTNSLNKNANDPRYWIRMKDKLIFMLGLSNVVILAVGTFDTNFHWFLPYVSLFFPLRSPDIFIPPSSQFSCCTGFTATDKRKWSSSCLIFVTTPTWRFYSTYG